VSKMKYSLYILGFIMAVNAQDLKTVRDEKNDTYMLVGIGRRSDITAGEYAEWYTNEYDGYQGDEGIISASKDFLDQIKIETFLGTWCDDSQKEVPRLYKILDQMQFPAEEMDLIMVDRDKKSGQGLEDGKNIHHVPTIIIYKNGDEVGRIVESPIESLEEDIFNILIGAPLEHNYLDWEEEGKD